MEELLQGKWTGINAIPFFNPYLKSLPFNSVCKKKMPTYRPTLKLLSRVTANKLFFKDGRILRKYRESWAAESVWLSLLLRDTRKCNIPHATNTGFSHMSLVTTKPTIWHVRPAKTQIRLGICPLWSESSLVLNGLLRTLAFFSCGQRRLWSDWANAQADLSLRWAHSHSVGFVMRRLNCHLKMNLSPTAVTRTFNSAVLRLGECQGWSESSLGAHAILLVLSWGGSILFSDVWTQ